MKKLIALTLCAALVAGIFSGCGQEDKTAHIPTGDGLYTGQEIEETAPEVTEPVQNQRIVMAYYAELGMNPYTCVDYTNRAVFPLIYQSLFVTDREGVTAPLLCKSFRVSADMKNYTFYIMDDARFADGDPVTGEDVTASLLAAMSSGYFAGRFSHVKSIANTRDGGVLIQMDTAFENLPLLLDIPIVKKEQVNSDMPIGSGPYVLRAMGTDTALYRNANWWCNVELPIEQQIIPLSPAANTVVGRPETARAETTALGPGTTNTSMPCCAHMRTMSSPGSEMAGIPASVTSAQVSPPMMRDRIFSPLMFLLCS